ncbi:glutaminyl-peptide cyclotransferase [Saccharopolyspora halophila]|uniref:glutaminyl-peptide cyclotransferase n=1 Tax=Saccharopolyspora halophila TaxID=405551 RepID=UPI0031CE0969
MLLTFALGVACAPHVPAQRDGQDDREQTDQGVRHSGSVPHLRAEVINTLPHDRSSFTQGFEIADGTLYEGTGKRGSSLLRATDLTSGSVLTEAPLPAAFFGEGITVTNDRIWQLTWEEGVAFERDRRTLRELRRVDYAGEGWGLCHDGSRLVMSDGSDRLTFRDPVSFEQVGSVRVALDGRPVQELNELDCSGGSVWANIWHSDQIVRIDPATGQVTAVVDASGLLSPEQQARAGVLNGIAAVPGTDEFLLTGKNWPTIFRVRFAPA